MDKIEDLKFRQDQDLAQTNIRLNKRVDDLQIDMNENKQILDEIERRRVEGETNILKRSMQILRESSLDGQIIELKRKVSELETEVNRPKPKVKSDIESEPIIKEIVQGMAEFEIDIKKIKDQLAEHDIDIQDAAKLIHVLDQQRIEDKEILNNLNIKISNLEKLKEIIQKDRMEFNQQIDQLRVATENEFNNVKKAEIQDFRRVSEKVNELIDLQDVVEQLADKIEFLEKQLEGIRRENDHTPVKMINKVSAEELRSSMTPSTNLYTSAARMIRNTITIDEELGRSSAAPDERYRRDRVNKNISFDLNDQTNTPTTDKVRESYLVRSRLARHLVDDQAPRQRGYIQIENDQVRKDEVANKLRGQTPDNGPNSKLSLQKMREDSFMPENYKLKSAEKLKNERTYAADRRRGSNTSGPDNSRAQSKDSKKGSKYTYDTQKNVGSKMESLHKGTDLDKPKKQTVKASNDLQVHDLEEDDYDLDEDYHESIPSRNVTTSATKFNRKNQI